MRPQQTTSNTLYLRSALSLVIVKLVQCVVIPRPLGGAATGVECSVGLAWERGGGGYGGWRKGGGAQRVRRAVRGCVRAVPSGTLLSAVVAVQIHRTDG